MNSSVLKKFSADTVGFFRFRKLGGDYLITNDVGNYEFLSERELELFATGALGKKTALHKSLQKKGFVRNYTDFDALIAKWRKRNSFLAMGTGLHIVVVTLRCDHKCVYCQTSSRPPQDKRYDMTLATAKRVVDVIFQSPNKSLSVEFQGGEPLLNWPVVKFISEYVSRKEKKTGKKVSLNLVSNLNSLDGKKLKFLLSQKVNICTSVDGPAALHNLNRVLAGGDSHAAATKWFSSVQKKTAGKIQQADALLTVTRASLCRHKEIVDEYLRLGARGIFLRPLTPLGMARETWDKIGYTPEEFLDFYAKALDYILKINEGGKLFLEQNADIFIAKILTDSDPNFMDLRSPCGAAIGQLAYNYDGKIFACDEARMLHEMGDSSFLLGDAAKDSYESITSRPAVKCLVTASCLDAQASCSDCAYKPYCGTCPVLNYVSDKDLFGHMPQNARCRILKGELDIIFKRLRVPRLRKIFQKWAALKPGQSA